MIGALSTALTGAEAQVARVGASASNTANQSTRGALPGADGRVPAGQPEAYRPVSATDVATAGGPRTVFRPITPSFVPQYEPEASYADGNGLVAAPNVDETTEATTRLTASRAYQANLAVIRTTDEMLKSLYDALA